MIKELLIAVAICIVVAAPFLWIYYDPIELTVHTSVEKCK